MAAKESWAPFFFFRWENSDITLVVLTVGKHTPSSSSRPRPRTLTGRETQQTCFSLWLVNTIPLYSAGQLMTEGFFGVISSVTKWEQSGVYVKAGGNCTLTQTWSYQHAVEVRGSCFWWSGGRFSLSWKSVRGLVIASPADRETPQCSPVCRGSGVHERDAKVVCGYMKESSQHTGLWQSSRSLNSLLFKAADICLDSKYRLSTIHCSSLA